MRLQDAGIIVIDDHADLAENLQEILEEEGALVRTAATASNGLHLARDPFEVALVDVKLPDTPGLSIVADLKSGDGLQEVLLVTGHASIQDAIEAVKAGAYAYVLKPFDPEELVGTVQRALEQVRLRRRTAALQAALERSEAELRTMVDTVQALLLVLDERSHVLQANQAVATATGVAVDDLLGVNWIEQFVPKREQGKVRAALEQLRRDTDGIVLESSIVRHHPELSERTISWRISSLWVGSECRIYASGLDVTDVRALEHRTRLAEKLAAVGTVSAGLAHEIRNPLNAALLQLQLFERRLLKGTSDAVRRDAKLHEPLDTVKMEIDRLSRLVTDFLTFARPRALNLSTVDLAAFTHHILDLEEPVAHERGVSLRSSVPDEPVVVEADVERLKQVLLNLVRNALDAVDRGGHVTVAVERDGAGARIRVVDDGPGIPPDVLSRMFEPFFTTKETGTGLGMAITHSLVELHGGSIEVISDVQRRGTEIAVTLPRHPPRIGK